jgi:hypothetical protein
LPIELQSLWHHRESHNLTCSEAQFQAFLNFEEIFLLKFEYQLFLLKTNLNDGGTFKPFGIEILPKSTKKATHQTDSQSVIFFV